MMSWVSVAAFLALHTYLLHFVTWTVPREASCGACPAAQQRKDWRRTVVQLVLLLLVVNATCSLACRAAGFETKRRSPATVALACFMLLLMPAFVYSALSWTQELRKCECRGLQNGTSWLRALAIFDGVVLAGLVLALLWFWTAVRAALRA